MASQGGIARAHDYELGHSDRELKRLRLQSELVDPFTRQFYQDAGVKWGMRVLDVGSGGGDAALLAAELVGEEGEVVGLDKAPAAVSAAQARVERLGKRNISFRQGDLERLEPGEAFDAVLGRYVLMFNPDPAAMVKSLARLVRPGGVIVFHETDWSGIRSNPVAPIYQQCHDWIARTFAKIGTNPHMGHDLRSVFVGAGMDPPSMGLRAVIQGPTDGVAYVDMIAELAITMAPVMEEQGVIAPGELDPATFGLRMRGEVERLGSVVVGRSEIGAWSRVS
jgi:SAM-dependent methyltransferase